MKRIIILTLLILLSIPNVILASNCTVSMSEKIKIIEAEKNNNLESIKRQLEDIGKLEHYEFHKEALEKQFGEIITNISLDEKIVINLKIDCQVISCTGIEEERFITNR